MRSPADMRIIQLELTDACESRCGGCTHLVQHAAKPFYIEPPQFERAVQSMEGWPGEILGAMGGNPVLHPDFERLSRMFARLWGEPKEFDNGRKPIADFSQYAIERLHDVRSGRGLWSSLGNAYYRHYEVIQEVYDHQTLNDHYNAGLHQGLLITRKEFNEVNQQSDDQWLANRDECWVQNTWSASINPHGAYFCEVAAAIDNVFYEGKSAWPVESGWWKRQPSDFNDQLHLCDHCALAQKGPSVVAHDDVDIVSPCNAKQLLQIGSPAMKKQAAITDPRERAPAATDDVVQSRYVEIYDPQHNPEHQHKARDFRIDWYMPEAHQRVSQENKTIKPHRLALAIVCVGRAEFLQRTFPHNAPMFDEVVVVTTHDDAETQRFICNGDINCQFVTSVFCEDHSESFNRGALLNEGLGRLTNADWILGTDCDIFLNPNTGDFLRSHALNPGCLYYTKRFDIRIPGLSPATDTDLSYPTHMLQEPNGYFQLFNRKALAIRDRWPSVMSEAFCSAAGVDTWFYQQYPAEKRIFVPELEVAHIEHGNWGAAWNGAERPGTWRQLGMITVKDGLLPIVNLPRMPDNLRLTDTLQGETITLDPGQSWESVVERQPHNLKFQGRDLGYSHIFVAYKT